MKALSFLLLLTVLVANVRGGPVNWTGTVGDWSTSGNWDAGVPQDGDDVTIGAGKTAILSSASMNLGSLDLTGTLMFTNWPTLLTATNITIQSGGVMTHVVCDTNAVLSNTNRVNVFCSNLTVVANGSVNVNQKGYVGYLGSKGQGPGGGPTGYRMGGAGYGSSGGWGKNGAGGAGYGSPYEPDVPGSAGGGADGSFAGGFGGGVIRILATGRVMVDGTITADGGTGGAWSGAGSGGGIRIAGNTFEGTTGSIHANGGPSVNGDSGGGGAGRLLINYDPTAQAGVSPQPTVKMAASGGEDYYAGKAGPGSLYLTDSVFLPSFFHTNNFMDVAFYGVTSFGPSSLTVSNTWIGFMESGIALTVGGDLKVTESLGQLDLSNGVIRAANNLMLANGGKLAVYGGLTNGTTPLHGAVVQVTNDLVVGPASWIYPYSHATNGLSPFFQCRNVSLAANGGFNANGTGFPAGPGTYSNGRGPGSTNNTGNPYGQGAGYGGRGGTSSAGEGGVTYGDPAAPVFPGSSGVSGQGVGGNGGGLVRIQAVSNVTVNGSILAGGNDSSLFGGGGSGGGVYITCKIFGGGSTGVIKANGGNGGYYANPGAYDSAGGGGRIAIIYDVAAQSNAPKPAVRFSANGAANYGHGQQGTLYFPDAGFFPYLALDGGYTIVIPGFTNWAPDSLSITSGWVRFPDSFTFNVTNDILVTGTDTWFITSNNLINCGGNMVISNGGRMYVYSAATNGPVPGYGALVTVGKTLLVASNGVVYPYSHATNGGSVLFQVGSLTIAAGGQINAEGTGYGVLPWGSGKGLGPGSGLGGVTFAAGSGYGGIGGDSSTHAGGPTYGSSNAPMSPGSSGVSGQNGQQSAGGGLVRVQAANIVTVDGIINANGQSGAGQFMGGGSGGGIYIVCKKFTGSAGGQVRADGAKEGTDARNGAGGGGRIAIYRVVDEYLGAVSATGAVHQTYLTTPTRSGGDGTVFWKFVAAPGTVFVVH